jgi:acyl-CoA thioesterase-1
MQSREFYSLDHPAKNPDRVLMKPTYVSRAALAIAALVIGTVLPGLASSAAAKPLTIVAFGDSLTAGYLLPQDKGFVPVLERELRTRGHDVSVINGGVSGDTTADGLARVEWSIPNNADGVILELGANDMLRGLDPAIPRKNLRDILTHLKNRKLPVFLAGMKAQRNFGPAYVEAFDSLYTDLAQEFGLPLYPFFLDKTAGIAALSLQDGLHPNPQGVEKIVADILPQVEEFLAKLH